MIINSNQELRYSYIYIFYVTPKCNIRKKKYYNLLFHPRTDHD